MTTTNSKTHCVTCGKGKVTYKCEGCSRYFCLIHLPDHHQELGKQLDEIEDNYNLFRETFNQQTQTSQKHPLIEQINQWEKDSIDKIEQTAEEARKLLMKYTDEYLNEIEIKLSNLTKELEEIRLENDFNEIDLNKFKQKLTELKEQLDQPSNISLEHGSSLFINKITVSNTSINTTTTGNNNDDDEVEDDSYEPNIFFKPIVHLSPVVVKTGEEDENILFCERAKLYRFDSTTNQMKERGIGEMKILQNKKTNICRILMRREQVLKICANHQITSQMELKPHQSSENAYLWSAMDFADGEAKHETLCIRFKSADIAKTFAKVFDEAKDVNAKKSADLPSVGKISLNDETKTKSITNNDDVIYIGEVKPSAEQIDRTKKLQLPSTFYLYENKEPCKSCPGCDEDTPLLAPNETPKTQLNSNETIKFPFANTEKFQPQLQKQSSSTKQEKTSVKSPSSAPHATSQYDTKPSIFWNFSGTSVLSTFGSITPLNNSNDSIFGGSTLLKPSNNTNSVFSFPSVSDITLTTPSTAFEFSTPAATSTATTMANTSSTFSFGSAAATSTNQPLSGNTPKFSFSDLAKQTPSSNKSTSNGTEQRVFAGQGSLIFGTSSVNTTTTGNNNEDDEAAVEVKTGEEDENILFCERAKLYRFDSATNLMKERGIGEMKILQHKTTKICRILMRREQVLKICANHQITSQMELKPYQGSENAYLWSAMDFADGEAKQETLSIRFKSSDSAKKFVKQFNDAKQANTNRKQ